MYLFDDLTLEPDYGLDESPPDSTNVNQFIMYFGDAEIVEFKALLKVAMKKEYPLTFQRENASDLMLTVLKKYYADGTTNNQITTQTNA